MLQVSKLVKLEELVGGNGEERRSQKEKWWWCPAGRLWSIALVILLVFLCSNKSFHQLYYTPPWLGEFPSGVMLLPHTLAHLAQDESYEEVRWQQRWRRSRGLCGAGWRWGASQHYLRRRHGGCCARYSPFLTFFNLCLYFLLSFFSPCI